MFIAINDVIQIDNLQGLEYIVACCIAMRLIYWDSERLIYLAGYTLRRNIKAESAYIGLLQAATQILTLDECDALNVLPLTKQITKNSILCIFESIGMM